MSYLDVSPMISALQSCPGAFEFSRGELHHIPSHHRFSFDAQHRVRVDAHCGCAFLRVRTDQEHDLYQAFCDWRASFWRPIEINREFASHFAPPSRLRGWLINLTGWLHRAALSRQARNSKSFVSVPAE